MRTLVVRTFVAAALAHCLGAPAAMADVLFDPDQFGRVDLAVRQSAGTARLFESLGARSDRFEPIYEFPPDDPIRVLGRKVGRLDILMEDAAGVRGTATCTATLIDIDKVITNHHCVPGERGTKIEKVTIRFGYLERGTIESVDFTVDKVPIEADKDLDYAILRVANEPGKAYGVLSLNVRSARPNERLFIIHHPLGQPQRLTRAFCRAHPKVAVAGNELRHQCDTLPGSSGSLIFAQTDNALVALHNKGGLDMNDAMSFNGAIDASAFAKMRVFASLCCAPKKPPEDPILPPPPQVRIPIPPLPPIAVAPPAAAPAPPAASAGPVLRITPPAAAPPAAAPTPPVAASAPKPSVASPATSDEPITKGLYKAPNAASAPSPSPPAPSPAAPPRVAATSPPAATAPPSAPPVPPGGGPRTDPKSPPLSLSPAFLPPSVPAPAIAAARAQTKKWADGPYEDKSRRLIRTLSGHSGGVIAAAFSPDGEWLLSGGTDKTVKLWHASSRAAIATLEGHNERVRFVAFSTDGRTIMSIGADDLVKYWDAATLRETRVWPAGAGSFVSLSRDGRSAFTRDQSGLSLWNVAEGQIVKGFAKRDGHSLFIGDGRALSIVRGAAIELWHIESDRTINTFEHRNVLGMVLSRSGNRLRSYAFNEAPKFWDLSEGKEIPRNPKALYFGSFGVDEALSGDGRFLAQGRCMRLGAVTCELGSAEISAVSTGVALHNFVGHAHYVKAVAFSPDGRYLISGSDDTTLKLWDLSEWAQAPGSRPAAKP